MGGRLQTFEVREDGEDEWSEFEAWDYADAAVRFAKFDYDVCDGWERNSNTYRVVVRGPDLPETEKTYVVEREFEPTFYAYAE